MLIEPLDPRRLLAASGLDTTFGPGGALRTGRTYDATETALAITGAIYVEERTAGTDGDVVKYNDNGQIDTTFGTAGRTPVLFDVTAMAYDKRTGQLYVGGSSNGTLFVERLLTDGLRDPAFGAGGIFRYTPGTPPTPGATGSASASVALDQLVVLPRHQVLVGLSRQTFTDDNAATPTTRQVTDVAVMRLRSNGTRDPGFGAHGVATVFSGVSQAGENPQTGTLGGGSVDAVTFGDVTPEADGYRVAFARATGTANAALVENVGEQIKSQRLTTAGVVDGTQSYSWTLTTATASGRNEFVPLLIADTGGTGVAVVGRTETTGAGPLTGYTLRPAHRPAATVLAGVGEATTVARTSRGFYFSGDNAGHVDAFNANFAADTRFAHRGAGATDEAGDPLALVPDADGRVLLIYDGLIDRLG